MFHFNNIFIFKKRRAINKNNGKSRYTTKFRNIHHSHSEMSKITKVILARSVNLKLIYNQLKKMNKRLTITEEIILLIYQGKRGKLEMNRRIIEASTTFPKNYFKRTIKLFEAVFNEFFR